MHATVTSIGADAALSKQLAHFKDRLPPHTIASFDSAAEAFRSMRRDAGLPDIIVIGPNEPAPVAAAERAVSLLGIQQVLVFTRAETHEKLAAELSHSIFLGNAATAVSLDDPDAAFTVLAASLERAQKQKRHQYVTNTAEAQLAASPPQYTSRRGQYAEGIWKHAPIGMLILDLDAGRVLDQNEQALALLDLGAEGKDLGKGALDACFPEEERPKLHALLAAEPSMTPVPTPFVRIRPSGEIAHMEMLVAHAGTEGQRLLILQDVTTRALAEEELRQKLALIEDQKTQIELLSTPILHVWERVLSLPIIGRLDEERTQRMMNAVLAEVSSSNAEFVVIDLTGAPSVDKTAASGLLALVQATRLLGATCLVSGMSAALARAIVDADLDLTSITTFPSLYATLRFVLSKRPREASPRTGAGGYPPPAPRTRHGLDR